MPKKTRKYATKKKTTTKEGKRDYMRQFMANQREVLKVVKRDFPEVYKEARRRATKGRRRR